jgi:diadenosine tetraphosphate (Ap4A) HIT family hydrolase
MDCPFCEPSQERVFYQDDLILCLWDAFPVSEGHALVITRRHVATWFDVSPQEQAAILGGIEISRQEIEKTRKPDGYNVGFNAGEAAGQTLFHMHVHVIPRLRGDVEDPRGGLRHVIPAKAAYWKPEK